MTDTPFLILHKVRGLPAFDIATKMRCPICQGVGGYNVPDFETGIISDYEGSPCGDCEGDGFWWIIPTSGHRAYPYWDLQLDKLYFGGELPITIALAEMPQSLPDHYSINDRQTKSEPKTSLISLLGLAKKIIRRI